MRKGTPLNPTTKLKGILKLAIYHCSTKTISRSTGRTAVASSAYRAGEKLQNEQTGLSHDFTKKQGVVHSEIISNLDVKIDRNELWNLAEKSENRKDARTAREWVIALPDELNKEERKELAQDFARSLVNRYGCVADLAIHEPSTGGNDKNHHAHIMLTTRKAELNENAELTLTTKTEIELSNTKRQTLNLGTTQQEIKHVREKWAELANHALEQAGKQQKIDHRSYAEQNSSRQATIHEGVSVTQMRRRGISTEISRFNDSVKQYNQTQQEKRLQQGLNRAEQGFEQWQKRKSEEKQKKISYQRQPQISQEGFER